MDLLPDSMLLWKAYTVLKFNMAESDGKMTHKAIT